MHMLELQFAVNDSTIIIYLFIYLSIYLVIIIIIIGGLYESPSPPYSFPTSYPYTRSSP